MACAQIRYTKYKGVKVYDVCIMYQHLSIKLNRSKQNECSFSLEIINYVLKNIRYRENSRLKTESDDVITYTVIHRFYDKE